MKLAQSVGNTTASGDDGITTGWICVNLGAVEEPLPLLAEEMGEEIVA